MSIIASINDASIIVPAVVLIIGLVLATILVISIAIFLISKYNSYSYENTLYVSNRANSEKKMKTGHVFLIILGIGLVVRIVCAIFIDGFFTNFDNQYSMVKWLLTDGFDGFYTSNSFDLTNSSPLMVYIYYITMGLGRALGFVDTDVIMSILYKLPFIVADIVLAVVLYKIASKHLNKFVGLAIGGIVALCPIFFVMSSMWGSQYSFYILFAVLAFYYLAKRNIPLMAVFATILLSLCSEALFIAPVFLVYMGYSFIKAIKLINLKKPDFDTAMSNPAMKNALDVPLYLIMSVCLIYLIALPAYFIDYGANFITVMSNLFIDPISSIEYFSANSLSIFAIFGQNGAELGAYFPTLIFGLLIIALVLIVSIILFISNKNRANLVLLGAFSALTVVIYFVGGSEWFVALSLALLLLSYILIKDKRLLKVFALYSIIYLVNGLLAMLYSNNIAMNVTSSTASESLLTFANAPVGFVISIILAVIAVITHIYLTVVTLDITLTNNRKLFDQNSYMYSFTGSIGAWLRK